MSKQVVLITGASSGFGELTAEKLLAMDRYIVYASARRVEKMESLKQQGAHILKMDVTDNDTVVAGVEQIIREQGKIDVLLNNAGYGSYGLIETIPIEEVQYQYDVNVFGMARVLQAVLPHMRKQRSGRVVITTSIVSHVSQMGLGWYASTKHALNAMCIALRQEVRDLGIEVVMIEPGAVNTGFAEVAFGTMDAITPPEDYRELHEGFRKFAVNNYAGAPGPESTANDMVKAITADKPQLVYKTTTDSKFMPSVVGMIPDRAFDSLILRTIRGALNQG
ncbi:SDR family NAD(P)-dependent oxidoreductase [bacterium]|nr:SDR family NAD(P)-dependent oxidoreductase [bacterium]